MRTSAVLLALLPLIQAQETILGVYIFHRHGDRTAKSWTPVNLTDLGYSQVYGSGDYYRSRYISGSSAKKVYGVNENVVKLTQLSVEAPVDVVLQNSATGFLQGLYPPVGATLSSAALANGSSVSAPLNGYQLIPVNAVASAASGANSENSAWLQGSSGCNNAIISSNNYFSSQEYLTTLAETKTFYQNLLPVINGTFTSATDTFKNAYTIYDLINVASIHNTSIQSANLLTTENLHQLLTRANQHEYGLAYNSSESIRAIAGSTLASQIVQQLNATIVGKSASKVGIQFGAYASFLAFFGLAQLPAATSNFTGIVDYASSMSFELFTNATVSSTSYPTNDQINVRFLFSNGSAAINGLTAYPLFGQSQTVLPWNTFVSEMGKFAIGDLTTWCTACGSTTGTCATATSSSTSNSSSASDSTTAASTTGSGSAISTTVAGVIGAMVTLAVILGLEALVLLVGGLRVVGKKAIAARNGAVPEAVGSSSKA